MPGLTTRVENDMFWCEIGIRMLLFNNINVVNVICQLKT